jgi:multidrug efflux pump subunit AcrA (membrane-fusion protein)
MNKKPYLKSFEMLHIPAYLKIIPRYLVIFFILFLLVIAVTPWQQTALGYGRVVAYSPTERQQNIHAPMEGRLGKWFVHEGSHVKVGDPIVEILDNDPEILNRLRIEKNAVQLRLQTSEQATETALINVRRQESLYNQGISSRHVYEQAKLEHARYLNEAANAKIQLAQIDVRLSRQQNQLIKATSSGTILRRTSGQQSVVVKAGDILAELVPDTDSRAVELWISGNDVPLVRINQETRLQFEGWPAIQFSGWPSVAVGTFGGRIAVIDAADNGQGRFRILIVPDPKEKWPEPKYLRQGVKVHGWVLLGQVKLWYELWRQFNGFPPTGVSD